MSTVPLLTANYSLWSDAMEDYLRSKGYWFQIHTAPPTVATDPKGWRHCMEARDSAVGEIRRHLSPELRSVALGSSDPLLILNAIKAAYGTSSFATCHKANAAQENQTPSESAGAASIRLSSSPSALPNTWNADTGATAHMTPRRDVQLAGRTKPVTPIQVTLEWYGLTLMIVRVKPQPTPCKQI